MMYFYLLILVEYINPERHENFLNHLIHSVRWCFHRDVHYWKRFQSFKRIKRFLVRPITIGIICPHRCISLIF